MRIVQEHSAGLVIDIQERLLPHIHEYEQLVRNTGILIDGLKALGIPLLLTEQYSKGLGETVQGISQHFDRFDPMEKTAFSCCDDPHFILKLNNLSKKNVIICGIEAHVCVLQTVIDLLEDGFQPVVVQDCISSRKLSDKLIAVQRMQQEGALITSYESILFELARVSGNETFKTISRLVR